MAEVSFCRGFDLLMVFGWAECLCYGWFGFACLVGGGFLVVFGQYSGFLVPGLCDADGGFFL